METISDIPANFPVMSVQEADRLMTTAPGSVLEIEHVQIRGNTLRTWKHAPKTILSVLQQAFENYADCEYVVYENERYTYRDIYERAAVLAQVLQGRFGIRRGDRVAIIMRNYPEWIISFWAIISLGAIAVPINAWLQPRELEHCLTDSGTKLAIVDSERYDRIVGDRERFKRMRGKGLAGVVAVRMRGGVSGDAVWTYEDVVKGLERKGAKFPVVEVHADDDATIFYTSGTTGLPKGALGTHRNFVSNVLNLSIGPVRSALRCGLPVPVSSPTDPRKSLLISVPLFHVTGCHALMQLGTFIGAKIVLMYKWDPLQALRLIEKERINNAGGVPSMVWEMVEHPDVKKFDLSSLEGFGYGGAPAAPELVRTVQKTLPTAPTSNGYGLTETSAAAIAISGPDYRLKPASIGVPLPIVDIKITSPDGKPLPPNSVGELWIRGPNVVKGYWNNPKATAASFLRDGWFKTGDIAKTDDEGFVYLLDRAKDMVIRGGENVYCVEVEDALFSHPGITDAAVFGIPHKVLGEEVAAVVTCLGKDVPSQKDIQEHCRKALASFKVPVYVEVRKEMLPRNANGKILKRLLKQEVVGKLNAKL
ncbi:hypothetical protein HK104_009305 [Borealophlyctis nickersoniae]|nr:hypothetical protein HK104_009305 [Borealophlyctis nickersoniae]